MNEIASLMILTGGALSLYGIWRTLLSSVNNKTNWYADNKNITYPTNATRKTPKLRI